MRRLVLLLAFFAAVPAGAQTDPIDALTDALALSDGQVELVEDVYHPGDPGAGWTLAAELGPTLDETQREVLLTPPRRPRGGGARPGRGARGERRGGPSEADRAVARAARDAALGLDAEASAALDEAIEDSRDARGAGALPPAVADLLTDEQEELVQIHRGLTRILLRARFGGRRGANR